MSQERKVELATRLLRLGVSQEGVIDLLGRHELDVIEAQLEYLPYRKAKRPEAFIVEAVRKNYSPPKELYYAQAKAELAPAFDAVDQGAQPAPGPAAAGTEGHGTENPPGAPAGDGRMEPAGRLEVPELQDPGEEDRAA